MGNASCNLIPFDFYLYLLSSTRNTRIERLWVEVGRQFMQQWRAFFMRLERDYHLQRKESSHIWLLTELFLPLINKDCEEFVRDWNRHSINNTDAMHMTPNVRIILMTSLKYKFNIDVVNLGFISHRSTAEWCVPFM
jgi:hypothetical protein